MRTMIFEGEVSSEGTLRLEIQTGLPAGAVEGVVVLQPMQEPPPQQQQNDFEALLARDLPNIDLLSVADMPLRSTRGQALQK